MIIKDAHRWKQIATVEFVDSDCYPIQRGSATIMVDSVNEFFVVGCCGQGAPGTVEAGQAYVTWARAATLDEAYADARTIATQSLAFNVAEFNRLRGEANKKMLEDVHAKGKK